MTDKATFVMYKSWRQLFKSLPKEQAADLICAIYDYQADGECDIEDPAVAAMFNMIRETMDADSQKYEETLMKRRKAGVKGGRPPKGKETKRNHLVSDGFTEKHLQASKSKAKQKNPVSDSVSVSVSDSVSDNEYDTDSPKGENISLSTYVDNSSAKPTRTPYQEVVDSFNEICISLPRVTRLTDGRKRLIRGRCSEYSMNEIIDMFRKAQKSDFLSGRNGEWNGCSFDWLMKPGNFVKVIEGNYPNRVHTGSSIPGHDELQEFYEMAAEWSHEGG